VHGNAAHAHYQVHPNTVQLKPEASDINPTTKTGSKLIKGLDIPHQIYYELTPERLAVLDLIAFTEGTDREIGNTKKGYDIYFTGKTFTDFSKHPNVKHKSGKLVSTAAGRYQFLTKTWNSINSSLTSSGFKPFPSFEPVYQDQGALFLIDKRGVLDDVDKRNIKGFLEQCSFEWASLAAPSTGTGRFGQPIISVKKSIEIYNQLFDLWNS
jgi:muramidase (phage lysozyme)